MSESWKPVVGYEGLYEVSDLGRVRSLDRIRCHGRRYVGRNLRTPKLKSGYLNICLSKDGLETAVLVHRLVAQAFIPNPDDRPTVNHINGVRHHNHVTNLEWATHLEQQTHARSGRPTWAPKGSEHASSKLTEGRASIILAMGDSGAYSQSEIGRIIGIHQVTVSKVMRRHSWKHVHCA